MKNIFFDLLNGLSVSDLVFISMQLFASMFIGHSLRLVYKFSKNPNLPGLKISTLVPILICFLVIISKNSAPLSISLLGIFMLSGKLRSKEEEPLDFNVIFLLGIAGFGCGAGYVLLTLAVFILLILPILYFSKN